MLRAQGYNSYGEYIASEHWRATRARYFASDLPQACICGTTEVQLHHMTYERVGAERLSDLTPLCHSCHALVHVLEFQGRIGLDLDGLCDEGRAVDGRALLARLAARRAREVEQRQRDERREVTALTFAGRLLRAKRAAKRRHVDISHDLFVLKCMVTQGRSDRVLTRKLRSIEARAYGWDDWAASAA